VGLVGAAAWPLAARAQQRERVRRIGMLMGWSDTDSEARSWFTAFVQGLAQFGWVDGGNVRIEQWWLNADIDRAEALAKELVAQQPDVILTGSREPGAHAEKAANPSMMAYSY
jgi:putative tryptophan/tyrosine transport system substrate-binding protein